MVTMQACIGNVIVLNWNDRGVKRCLIPLSWMIGVAWRCNSLSLRYPPFQPWSHFWCFLKLFWKYIGKRGGLHFFWDTLYIYTLTRTHTHTHTVTHTHTHTHSHTTLWFWCDSEVPEGTWQWKPMQGLKEFQFCFFPKWTLNFRREICKLNTTLAPPYIAYAKVEGFPIVGYFFNRLLIFDANVILSNTLLYL